MSVFRRIAVGEFIFESAQDGLIAAGTTQATAYQLQNAELHRVTSGSGGGVALPPAQPGMSIAIVNHCGGNITVYGQPGDTIDDAPSANGILQMNNSWVFYCCFTAGAWYTEGLASGFSAVVAGGGVPGAFATGSAQSSVTASQTHSAAGGVPIVANQVLVATVATNQDAVTLPPAKPGLAIVVQNNAGSTLQVWAATFALGGTTGSGVSGDLINSGATSFNIAASGTTPTVFYCFSAGQWFTK